MAQLNRFEKEILNRIIKGKKLSFLKNGKPTAKVRASFLKKLILGLPIPDPIDSKKLSTVTVSNLGLELSGVIIEGVFDLSHSRGKRNRTLCPLQFKTCHFSGEGADKYDDATKRPKAAFNAQYCHFSDLSFEDCKIGFIDLSYSEFKTKLSIDGLNGFNDNGICRIKVTYIRASNSVAIKNTTLNLSLSDSSDPENPWRKGDPPNYALQLNGAVIDGELELRPNLIVKGGVNLKSARITGDVWADGSTISAKENNKAIEGQYSVIKGVFGLTAMFHTDIKNDESDIQSCIIKGAVSFLNATIGTLYIAGASFERNSNEKNKETGNLNFNLCSMERILIAPFGETGNITTPEYQFVFVGSTIRNSIEIRDKEKGETFWLDFSDVKVGANLSLKNIKCRYILLNDAKIKGKLFLNKVDFSELYARESTIDGSVTIAGTLEKRCDFSGSIIGGNFCLGTREYLSEAMKIDVRKIDKASIILENVILNGLLRVPLEIEFISRQQDGWLSQQNVSLFRSVLLDFYEGWELVEITYTSHGEKKAYSAGLLVNNKEGRQILLDGKSNYIHQLNKDVGLSLKDAVQAESYLLFFCSFVWGEDGPFRVVESGNDLMSLIEEKSDVDDSLIQLKNSVTNVSVNDKAEGDSFWKISACVFYKGVLFQANFKVFETGMVEMVDDTPLGDLSEYTFISYDSPFREIVYEGIPEIDIFPVSAYSDSDKWNVRKNDERIDGITSFIKNELSLSPVRISDISTFERPLVNLKNLRARGLDDGNAEYWNNVILVLNGFEYNFFKDLDNLTMESGGFKEQKRQKFLNRLVTFIRRIRPFKRGPGETEKNLRLDWLDKQYAQSKFPNSHEFKPQPYEQVAKVFRQQGNYEAANSILIKKLRLSRRFKAQRWQKPYLLIWDLLYRFGLKINVIIFTFLVWFLLGWAGVHIANTGKVPFTVYQIVDPVLIVEYIPVSNTAANGSNRLNGIDLQNSNLSPAINSRPYELVSEIPCTDQIEPSVFVLDMIIPLLDLGQNSECRVSKRREAVWWRVGKAIYTIFGWITISILVIALTGYFKREVEKK
ncbi:MAG: hypothetical protein RIM99_08350 [Cyclobacteriaceae bacterium]